MNRRILVPGFGRRVGVVLVAIAIACQVGVVATVAWGVTNPRQFKDWLVVGKVAAAQTLDGYVESAGISSTGRFYLFAAKPTLHTPETFDTACPVKEIRLAALGCVDPETEMVHLLDINDETLSTLEPVVAAHQMLHAVWARLDDTEQKTAAAEIESTVSAITDQKLIATLSAYDGLQSEKRTAELFAVLGTEVNTVSANLEELYARFFDDRTKVVVLAATSSHVIESIMTSIDEVGRKVVAADEKIGKERKDFQKERKALQADINIFNDNAATKGFYESKSKFTADKNALATRQAELEKKRVQLNKDIEEYNKLVDELARLNDQAMTLNRALGIDASTLAPIPTEP